MEINTNMIGSHPFKAKRKKFGIISLVLMLIVGAALIGIGNFIHKSLSINPKWSRENGTVVGASAVNSTHGGTTYAPIVSYTVEGQTYKVTSSSSTNSYPANGSVRQVAYDPSNPQDAKVVENSAFVYLFYLFPIIGALMIVGAPIAFVRSVRRTEDINHLLHDGQKIQGVITDIQVQNNSSNNNNGGSSYRLTVSATDPNGTVQNYTSDWMSGIGGLAMADYRSNPIPLDVYINPANPSDYYVDITEVPNLTPERITELIQSAIHNRQPQSLPPLQIPGAAASTGPQVNPAVPPVPPMPQAAPPPEQPEQMQPPDQPQQ